MNLKLLGQERQQQQQQQLGPAGPRSMPLGALVIPRSFCVAPPPRPAPTSISSLAPRPSMVRERERKWRRQVRNSQLDVVECRLPPALHDVELRVSKLSLLFCIWPASPPTARPAFRPLFILSPRRSQPPPGRPPASPHIFIVFFKIAARHQDGLTSEDVR